ncbi:MAG: dipeptidase [Bacteroidota bacterium]
MASPQQYADQHADRFVDELIDLLRIPSVSTDPAHASDVRRAAQWMVDHLQRVGVQHVELCETPGHPIVYGEHMVDERLPTVLIYGHYDVQPPDPLDLWTSAPFEPVIKDGDLYARGSCDDKGQVFMYAKALEAYFSTEGKLPVNVKLLIEGEEENGSVNLDAFIEQNVEKLAADVILVSDTALFADGVPTITYGLRGLAYVEVTLTGPDRDLHSGAYGGAVENPANALARLIANLHDADHRVTIPGFYDNVQPLDEDEREAYRQLPFDKDDWMGSIALKATKTEAGYTALEGKSARPTLDVNGMWSGYTGSGAKTVLPSAASAKISMRLVPNQTPEEITEKIRAYFEANTPETMTLTFTDLHGGHGSVVERDSPAMRAAADAMAAAFGRETVFIRAGGSIPVVASFKQILGLDTILLGFGLNTDALHSPNERFGLDRFHLGIQTIIGFLKTYGADA